jgi:pimeloyl-ACP methyl ester carboxylesterase
MGCLVAVHLAHKYPQSIERLILYEPPLFADVPDFRAHARARTRYFSIFAYIAKHPELLLSADGKIRERLQRIAGMSLDSERWVPFSRSLENTIMNQAAYDELHDITVPTDIVHGRLDFVVTRADVKKMLASNPNITFHMVNRIHGISRSAARELARLLARG